MLPRSTEIRIDATVAVNISREGGNWKTFTTPVKNVTGNHDLCFVVFSKENKTCSI
jgi:hypothetical protein